MSTATRPGRGTTRPSRVRLITAALATTTLSACALSTSTETPSEQPTTPSRGVATTNELSRSCPAIDQTFPVSADIVNRVVANTTLPAWRAADIGASAKLSDNRLAWVFGDTVRSQEFDPPIVANSILISSGLCIAQVMTPQDGPILPDVSKDVVHWPMSIARLAPDQAADLKVDKSVTDLLVVLAGRIRRGHQNAFDFTYLGTSAAIFTVQAGKAPQLLGIQEITPDRESETQINWGSASFIEGEWAYVYGSRSTGREYEFGRELYVARTPVAHALDRSRWQFWDGSTWQTNRDAVKPVLPASEGVSQTLSVSKTHGRYVVVSKRGGDLGDFVYTWTSDTPVGPWTPHEGVKAPFGLEQGELKYAPLGHPSIQLASGKLLISVSRNTTDLDELTQHAEKVGRPTFAEVEIPTP